MGTIYNTPQGSTIMKDIKTIKEGFQKHLQEIREDNKFAIVYHRHADGLANLLAIEAYVKLQPEHVGEYSELSQTTSLSSEGNDYVASKIGGNLDEKVIRVVDSVPPVL